MAAPEKRRRGLPVSLWELSKSRLCRTAGAGRDTDPVPCSMCIAVGVEEPEKSTRDVTKVTKRFPKWEGATFRVWCEGRGTNLTQQAMD
jgi:hypothetical protein